ncbi:MAG: hypothetical protein IPK07_01015 [Deltaproteobacteria bacterium]|nr:hypothetical protein [Deltaproteobacteria bacterium]
MRGLVTGMAGRASGIAAALVGGLCAGALAAAVAFGAGRVLAPGVVARGAVRVPVLDGVPLLDVDKVRAEVAGDAEQAGTAGAAAISVRLGAHWNEVVVEARAADADTARRLVAATLAPARDRAQGMLGDALAQAENLETVLLERFDAAEQAGDAHARADAEVAVASFRLKRDALLEWTTGLVDPVELRSPTAGPLRAGATAGLVAALVLGFAGAFRPPTARPS